MTYGTWFLPDLGTFQVPAYTVGFARDRVQILNQQRMVSQAREPRSKAATISSTYHVVVVMQKAAF